MNMVEPEMIDLTRSRNVSAIRAEYQMDPSDPLKIIALVQKQEASGLFEDAVRTIKVAFSRGVMNDYLEFALAKLSFQIEEYEESWDTFSKIVQREVDTIYR